MFKVLNQPQDGAIGYLLEQILDDNKNGFKNFYFLVAYAKRSGVGRLSPFLKKFRDSGGKVLAVVGIDQKQTSFEALEELLSVSDELYIFHNEIFTRTFHPKLYFFESPDSQVWISVGSSNLTGGGLYSNYEINSLHSFDLSNEESKAKLSSFVTTFNNYSNLNNDCCRKADSKLIQDLLDEGYIFKEEQIRKNIVSQKRAEAKTSRKVLFGKESFPEPPSQTTILKKGGNRKVNVKIGAIKSGFWKKLSAKNDVSKTSSPGQIIIPKHFVTYFPPFDEPIITPKGGEQSEAFLNVIFKGANGRNLYIENARAIFYIPAPDHPRQNIDFRFTFRSKEVSEMLSADDILEFKRSVEPAVWFVIRQIKPNNPEYNTISKGKRWNDI